MLLTPATSIRAQDLVETQFASPSDGAAHDEFGRSVSISGDFAIIGAWRDDDAGSAYVYRLDGADWIVQQKLTASDGAPVDEFGESVSISGDVAIVGAPGDDGPIGPKGTGDHAGGAYIFRYDGATWNEEQKLTASDAFETDYFGFAVSISGDVAIVGAYGESDLFGAAYIFRFNGATWIEEQKLAASDGALFDFFGIAVSIDGDVAVVGAHFDDNDVDESGSAYMFRYDGATWNEEQKITASDAAEDDVFGSKVSISGDHVIVGAAGDDDIGSASGAAYTYRFDGATWGDEQKLTASDATDDDAFGGSVSISGNTALIGARRADGLASETGAAYLFRYDGSTWNETQKLFSSEIVDSDLFGRSVSISGDRAVIAAEHDDPNGVHSGSATFFGLPCASDITSKDGSADGETDTFDLLLLLSQWNTAGPDADIASDPKGPFAGEPDGVVDTFDLLFMLSAWGACP